MSYIVNDESSIESDQGIIPAAKSCETPRVKSLLKALVLFLVVCVSCASVTMRIQSISHRRRLFRRMPSIGEVDSRDFNFSTINDPLAAIPVFYINVDASTERREFMESELSRRGMKYKRVSAATELEAMNVNMEIQSIIPTNNHEVACIISHLAAMWEAVNDRTISPDSPYAIIMEDDVEFQFDIDFLELVKSAPPDFNILQLTTSNSYEVGQMWKDYKLSTVSSLESLPNNLWRRHKVSDGLWSTQAYIIRKDAVRNFIGRTVKVDPISLKRKFTLVSPGNAVCQRINALNLRSPCLLQFRIVADLYLYAAVAPTYTIRIPIFNGAAVGSVSLIPTTKNKDVAAALTFSEIAAIILDVKDSRSLIPKFIKPTKKLA